MLECYQIYLLGFWGLFNLPLEKVMVARMALIIWILESKLAMWLYEQPHTSMLFQHPRMQELLKSLNVYRCHMYMGSYGTKSPKPTHLWSPTPAVNMFNLPLPGDKEWAPMVSKKLMPDGRVQVTGNSLLKNSQTYPREFGFATLRVWKMTEQREFPKENTPPKNLLQMKAKDSWKDADLTDVFQFLSLGTFKS